MLNPHPYAIVLDDHPLVARGIAQYLQALVPGLSVSVATNWVGAMAQQLVQGCPLLLVADVWLADDNSLSYFDTWRSVCPDGIWLAISGDDDPRIVQRVRAAGAQGFVHKQASSDVFDAAFSTVLAGGQWYPEPATGTANVTLRRWEVSPAELGLTTRQGDILSLVLRGLPNKRIALMLGITESTVKEHITAILQRMGASNRVELMTLMQERRLTLQKSSR
ncbi:response regulator transcription factor [Rhodoferax sp.]|uniref:LuxR C-terminal-related transcriptional regulator n=1 Tax=Rhodoferax sp. TaxID=50421 RepID=UPI00260C76A7|nr:response regulator transcription factor [Rhodoferax sp.]MDD2925169.1 response regulator transcription factor [Rhodoferax sp.]